LPIIKEGGMRGLGFSIRNGIAGVGVAIVTVEALNGVDLNACYGVKGIRYRRHHLNLNL